MSAKKTGAKIETLNIKPSEFASCIRSMMPTNRALFGWGPPGVAKSAVGQQVASAEQMAFIDVRLSQMDPTDLRGIPYPVVIGGVHGVRWSAPLVLPRDLDFDQVTEIEAEETIIHFSNPTGTNGIAYCTKPEIAARAIGKGVKVEITDKTLTSFTVAIRDANGDVVGGKVHWTVTGKVRGILALEEFNSAPPSVQAAAYQLVLDRALGEYKVPEGVFIIAMGNRDTDKGITYKMPTPIANRFVHVEIRPDFEDWQRWALQTRISPDVVGYLTAFKNHLFEFEPGTASRGFATPRSWHFVSDILEKNPDMSEAIAMALVFGSVGEGIGVQFIEFRKIAADLPEASKILDGSLKKMPNKVEVSLAYALTTTLCYELKERADQIRRTNGQNWLSSKERAEWLKQADNFLEFMMANFQPEICIMGAKAAISVHKLPFDTQKMKHFDTFAQKFKDLIMN